MRKFAVQSSNKQYEACIQMDSSVHVYVIEFAVHKRGLQASIQDLRICCKTFTKMEYEISYELKLRFAELQILVG